MVEFAKDYLPLYFQGTLIAIGVAALSMALSVAIGLVGALGRLSGNQFVRSCLRGPCTFSKSLEMKLWSGPEPPLKWWGSWIR